MQINACAPEQETKNPPENASQESAVSTPKTCYQKLTGSGENTDAEVLILNQEGKAFSGEYHWLPAFKDQRLGKFSGESSGQGMRATYTYLQEGSKGSESIQLDKQNDRISISGGAPELGLVASLPAVNCAQLVSIPPLNF